MHGWRRGRRSDSHVRILRHRLPKGAATATASLKPSPTGPYSTHSRERSRLPTAELRFLGGDPLAGGAEKAEGRAREAGLPGGAERSDRVPDSGRSSFEDATQATPKMALPGRSAIGAGLAVVSERRGACYGTCPAGSTE